MGTFERGRGKTGGRKRGVANKISFDTRKAIIEALTQLGNEIDQGNRQGVISFIKAACRENLSNGIKLLTAITPKMLDLDVQKTTTVKYRTIEEIEADLEKRGIPKMKEIFAIDYRGTDPVIEPEPEIIPPQASAKPT
jgi:hypothetical protein